MSTLFESGRQFSRPILFILLVLFTGDVGSRSSRAASSTPRRRYSVETLVVVDEEAYGQWLALQSDNLTPAVRTARAEAAVRDFVRATFASANLILQGLEQYGIHLDVRIQDIRIVRGEQVTPLADPTTKSLYVSAALWGFQPWLIRKGLEYDHALLLTGYDLVRSPNTYETARHASVGRNQAAHAVNGGNGQRHVLRSVEGYAYMSRMCMPDSLSVVENTRNGVAAVVFAHELGHVLGANHDGDRNSCDSHSGYIMNDNDIGMSQLRWNYSSCAAERIGATLDRLSDAYDCLSPGSTWAPPVTAPYLGQLHTADAVCQMAFGDHSYVCRHLYGPAQQNDLCDVLWCIVNSTYCSGKASVDGVVCGAGKRCLAGQCVPFDDVPLGVRDSCPLGDVPRPVWKNRTCSDIVRSFTHNCLDDWYTVSCCGSCEAAYTGNDACPYGDAHDQCAPHLCGREPWDGECCVTCPPSQ